MGDVTALLCSSTHRKNDGGPKDSADHREGEACGESENTPNTSKEANDELWFFFRDNSPIFRDNSLTFGDFSGII